MISADRSYLFIQTANGPMNIDFTKATIQTNFAAGKLVSSDGVVYISTTDDFALNNPAFMSSYYVVYQLDYKL